MKDLKKIGLLAAAFLCAALIISPADILSSIGVDDIVYLIGAIAGFGKIKKNSAEPA